jgi:hypothetical protein
MREVGGMQGRALIGYLGCVGAGRGRAVGVRPLMTPHRDGLFLRDENSTDELEKKL